MGYGDTPETIKARQENYDLWFKRIIKIAGAGVVVVVALILVFGAVMPQLNLYRANTEKQAVIAEQKAESEAAEYRARSRVTQAEAESEAEIIRAGGIAEANRIIAESITPEYVDYLFVRALETTDNQVIYVATESGLPVLEASRLTPAPD
jgi:hypothetical protein